MPTTRRLILVRHAKTEPTASSDRERELTERGHRQAAALGAELGGTALGDVRVLVSAAVRARQTWQGMAGADGPDDAVVGVLEPLYSGGPGEMLDAVGEVPEEADTVIVVGHNPTVADLVGDLSRGSSGAAYDALQHGGYPPSTATVFDVSGQWAELDADAVTLTGYVGPQA